MHYKKFLLVGFLLIGIAIALAACASAEPTPCPDCPEPEPCPTAAPCPDCPACPEPVVADVPYEEDWAGSGHSDETAEAFRHWDEEDPQDAEHVGPHRGPESAPQSPSAPEKISDRR